MNIINFRVTNAIGGSERYIMYLFTELMRRESVNVTHVTNYEKFYHELKKLRFNAELVDKNINEVGTKREIIQFVKTINHYLLAYYQIIKIIRKNDTDIVILHSMTEKILLSPLIKVLGVKLIWFEHGPLFITRRSKIIKYAYRFISLFSDLIIVVSKDTKHDLIRGGIKKNRLEINYIGIDLEKFASDSTKKLSIKSKLGFKNNDICIGYVGNLNEEKGIGRFIDVCEEMIRKQSNYKFLVIGTGPLLKKIKSKTKGNMRYFKFTGHVDSVSDYLQCLDFLVLPTNHYEGISLAILEAMAMKVCVVTNDIGGNKELIKDYINGIKYKNFSKSEIATLIHNLQKNKRHLNLIQENARKRVESTFDIKISDKRFFNYLKYVYEK